MLIFVEVGFKSLPKSTELDLWTPPSPTEHHSGVVDPQRGGHAQQPEQRAHDAEVVAALWLLGAVGQQGEQG